MANGSAERLSFPACRKRRIEAGFDGGDVTSKGAVPPLRQADRLIVPPAVRATAVSAARFAIAMSTCYANGYSGLPRWSLSGGRRSRIRETARRRRFMRATGEEGVNAVLAFPRSAGSEFPTFGEKSGSTRLSVHDDRERRHGTYSVEFRNQIEPIGFCETEIGE